MGRIIQQNNGKKTILVTGENISSITPEANTYVLGVDLVSGLYEKLNPNGSINDLEGSTGGLSSNLYEVTYSELTTHISNSTLSGGSYYMVTDFQTCYDQPDFDYNGSPIMTGNYKQGPVEPILVLATSTNTISEIAYQPAYPKDRILYDWTWNLTEVTSGVTFGRITERIDEFNNRTDYDHRNILFKRYKLFTYRLDQPLNGTIQLLGDGTVNGTNTTFTGLTVGDVIYIPSTNPSFYEILSITGNTDMTVSGDTISSIGGPQQFYKAIEETNDSSGYFSYKRTNVKTYDFVEYTTFGDAISNDYAKNNYVGNFANNYQSVGNGFILTNNVFLEGQYESNKFGDYCYNNTWGTDNQKNVWGDWCYGNVSTNDIDDNIIGHYFSNNLLNVNLTSNHIGNDFNNNKLLAENSEDFEGNIIGNGFNSNVIYSRFYKNEILDNFNNNTIGDSGSLSYIIFHRNYIRNNFNNNNIRRDFDNNQIGTNFQENNLNGLFQGNTVLNGFNNNTVGSEFKINNVGNAFNNNFINDDFNGNTTSYGFAYNYVSNNFYYNTIGHDFNNNTIPNLDLFGWSDLSTVSTRTYNTFNNSLGGGQIGNRVLNREFIMRIISNSRYFKIKFTQWTAGGSGGGFQYTREEIDSSGNSLGPVITFIKTDYGSEIDVIEPGVVEITRGNNNGAIYNVVSEVNWNSSVSPDNTEWNSIYTEPNNGKRFAYNKIGNNFTNNTIDNDFGFGGNIQQGNIINDSFENNTIGQFMYNNVIGNYFTNNTIGDDFEDNQIQNFFIGNTIGTGFTSNQIGNYFGNNGSAGAQIQNTIFNDFKYNKIGNFFGNDTNFTTIGGGTNGDGGNIINDGFQYNEIGDNFIFNALDLSFTNNKIGNDFWLNIFGLYTNDNVIGNLFVGNGGGTFPTPIGDGFISNKLGNYSGFNTIGANFKNNEIGDFFGNNGTSNTIPNNFNNNKIGNYFGDDGLHTTGGNTITNGFYDNLIGNKFYGNTIDPLFHSNDIGNEFYSNIIQDNPGDGEFQDNEIGNGFNGNTTSGWFYKNQIANDFNGNTNIGDYFESNIIGNSFNSNPIIGNYFNNNVIGDSFQSNNIGQDFYYNTIGPPFDNNITTTNFNSNKIKTQISSIDFTDFYGNITGFTYSAPGSSAGDGLYLLSQDSTSNIGVNATFDIEVSSGAVIGVTGNTQGKLYAINDTLTILGSQIFGTDGVDDVVITVTGISQLPSVYETYTCDIFERQGGTKRLSYYDSSDILTITNINE